MEIDMPELTMTYEGETVKIQLIKKPTTVLFGHPATFKLDWQPKPSLVTDEIAADILVAALEGGSNYWADLKIETEPEGGSEFLHEVVTKGGELTIIDREDGYNGYVLDLAKWKLGIEKMADYRGMTVERFHEEHDALEADAALQFALFGEIVYG